MKRIVDGRFHWCRFVLTPILSILLSGFSPKAGLPQTGQELNDLRNEIRELREKQNAFQKELQALKTRMLPRAIAVEPVDHVISIVGSPSKGDDNAELILVEFSDYQCPFCARHSRGTMPQIESEYINTGKIKYVFRDFPIEAIHPGATKRHVIAHCAGEQDNYWAMHDFLFAHQKQVDLDALPENSKFAAMDLKTFLDCVGSDKYADTVRQNFTEGHKATVRGTPSFFLGTVLPDGNQIQAMWMIRGAVPYSVFSQTIEKLLRSRKPRASIR